MPAWLLPVAPAFTPAIRSAWLAAATSRGLPSAAASSFMTCHRGAAAVAAGRSAAKMCTHVWVGQGSNSCVVTAAAPVPPWQQ